MHSDPMSLTRFGPFGGLLLLLFFVVGCLDSEPNRPERKPFAGQQLDISVPAGLGFPAAWDLILDEWTEQTGAKCRLREYDLSAGSRPLAEWLGHGSGASSTPGAVLMVFPITQVAELAAEGLLASIPQDQQSEGNLHWLDLLAGLRKNVATLERKPTVVPLSCPALVCYYRRDLLEKAKLSPPKTWSDYQKLIDSLDRWAPARTAVEPWGEEYRATMFLARAVSYAKHPGNFSLYFDYKTAEPLIDGAGFVRALEAAKSALAKMPHEVTEYTPADCRTEILAGRAALAVAFETGPGNPVLPFGPTGATAADVAGVPETKSIVNRPELMRIGFCRLPGVREVYNRSTGDWEAPPDGGINQVTLTGFGGLCAAVSTNVTPLQAQTAWNLLARLSLDNLETAFPGATKSPCRALQVGTAAPWTGTELADDERFQYLDTVAQSLRDTRLVAELPVVGRNEFRAALSEQIGSVLAGNAEPAAALEAAARRWREIIADVGVEAVRDSYRRSLGLSPRGRNRAIRSLPASR